MQYALFSARRSFAPRHPPVPLCLICHLSWIPGLRYSLHATANCHTSPGAGYFLGAACISFNYYFALSVLMVRRRAVRFLLVTG